jgi:DNA-binding MarR family transcriptional regulator
MPGPVFPRYVLLRSLDHGRAKVRRVLPALTDAELAAPSGKSKTFEQRLLESLERVREHGGQLPAFVEGRRA